MPNYNGEQMIAAAQRGDKAAYRKAIIEHEKQHLRDFWSKRGEFLSEVKQYEKKHDGYFECRKDWFDNWKRYFDIILSNKYREISDWSQRIRR